MKAEELITEAMSLPLEERARVAETILRSMNPLQSDAQLKWEEVATRRLKDLLGGGVEPIPGDEVFSRIWKRFGL